MHCEIAVKKLVRNEYEVRFVLPDFVGLLSVIAGLFASRGIEIVSGKIQTVRKNASAMMAEDSTINAWI